LAAPISQGLPIGESDEEWTFPKSFKHSGQIPAYAESGSKTPSIQTFTTTKRFFLSAK